MARLQVNPTRIELNKCKTRLKAAVKGHKLLKDKSDEMIRRFLELAKEARLLRFEADEKLKNALRQFVLVKAIADVGALEKAFETANFKAKISIESRSIMGINVPIMTAIKTNDEFKYDLIATPPQLDNAVQFMQSLAPLLLDLAQKEKACSLLSSEIEKTRRRVNALEHIMIPQLHETIAYIQMKLDENERSALARLMQVKDSLEKHDSNN